MVFRFISDSVVGTGRDGAAHNPGCLSRLDLIKQVFEERERNNNDKSEKTNLFKLKSAVFEICAIKFDTKVFVAFLI